MLSTIHFHVRSGYVSLPEADRALTDLRDWPGHHIPVGGLLDRAWELRDNVRPYDALYVALAEALDATLVTLDGRLARAPGPRCPIELL